MSDTRAVSTEWTEHTNVCALCKRAFRICADAWREARHAEPSWSDAETVASFDFCLKCSVGEDVPEEYVESVATPLPADVRDRIVRVIEYGARKEQMAVLVDIDDLMVLYSAAVSR